MPREGLDRDMEWEHREFEAKETETTDFNKASSKSALLKHGVL